MQIYRLIMPAKDINWSNSIIEGFFYGFLNLILSLPLTIPVYTSTVKNIWGQWSLLLISFLLLPMIWPFILSKIFNSKKISSKLNIPFPTSWDYFFNKREPLFILIHLKNGGLIGGYYGDNSYTTAYPNDGEIYLEAVYKVNKEGTFGKPIDETKGLLIRKDQYSYIELFSIPKQ